MADRDGLAGAAHDLDMSFIARTTSNRARIAAALSAAGLALVAASPAGALPRSYDPGDTDQPPIERTPVDQGTTTRKGCELFIQTTDGGKSLEYPDGYSFSVKDATTGKTITYTCSNGTWVRTVSATQPIWENAYQADYAYIVQTSTS